MEVAAKQEKVETTVWLIVELENSASGNQSYYLMDRKELVNPPSVQELHTGKVVNVKKGKIYRKGNVVIISEDKQFLETELQQLQETARRNAIQRAAKISNKPLHKVTYEEEEEDVDYSLSDSDWNPNAGDLSPDTDEENTKLSICDSVMKVNTSYLKIDRKGSTKTVAELKMVNNREVYSQSIKDTAQKLTEHLAVRQSPGFLNTTAPKITWNETTVEGSFNFSDNEEARDDKPAPKKRKTNESRIPPMTFDQQTQTVRGVDSNLEANQSAVRNQIQILREVVGEIKLNLQSVESALSALQALSQGESNGTTEQALVPPPATTDIWMENSMRVLSETTNNIKEKKPTKFEPAKVKYEHSNFPLTPFNMRGNEASRAVRTINGEDMVNIGINDTLIPSHIYNRINWTSHTQATRKLLMAVFPRRTLATHSLTGKSSPAFINKPAKRCLDRKKIADIVMTVAQNCGVQESQVRSIITTKCADENKMYKMRLIKMNMRKTPNDYNQENQSPLD